MTAVLSSQKTNMKITSEASDAAVLEELGRRVARVRLEKNLTQAQLAERADVAKRTVERLEAGSVAPQLAGFVRICRALDLVERFEHLVPELAANAAAPADFGVQPRRRASRPGPRGQARGAPRGSGAAAAVPKTVRAVEVPRVGNDAPAKAVVAAASERAADVVVVAHHLN